MRGLKSSVGWPRLGWLWLLALLVLPDCSFDTSGSGETTEPHTTAVFCDIPLPPPDGRRCASLDDEKWGVRQPAAAVALNIGDSMKLTLDESNVARSFCPGFVPQAVVFQGAFPVGQPFCADRLTLTDPDAFCVEKCKDFYPAAFCADNARASTNVPHTITAGPDFSLPGFPGGCTSEGTVLIGVTTRDPRIDPDPVRWTDLAGVGVLFGPGSLTRTADTTGGATADFNAGAASDQWIKDDDAYVEFSAAEPNKSHVVGLSEIPFGCVFPCFDTDRGLADITFAISLNNDGRVYVIEGGVLVLGDFGTYTVGERFRISLRKALFPNTAKVTYSRKAGACIAGTKSCVEAPPFYTSVHSASYALRVDASFREQAATVSNVVIMRVK